MPNHGRLTPMAEYRMPDIGAPHAATPFGIRPARGGSPLRSDIRHSAFGIRHSYPLAFTLVELLIVITIITLLIALALPTIKKAKEAARMVKCATQMRSVAIAFNVFAEEHHNILPGNAGGWAGSEPWQKAFLGDEFYRSSPIWGHDGTLLEYINGEETARKIFRCPSLAPGEPGSSVGSNGRYEYVSPCVFSGANRDLMPPQSQDFFVPRRTVTTPLIVEEDPASYGNDGILPEPAYSNLDRMGSWHAGHTSNYAAVDTSAHQISFRNRLDSGIIYWRAIGPSGQEWSLGGYSPAIAYGMWNRM